jgi:hypothetical protein
MRQPSRGGAAAAIVLTLLLALGLVASSGRPVSAQNTACYRPVGGASFECADGGSIVVKSGATLFIQSGGTLDAATGSVVSIAAPNLTGNVSVSGVLSANGSKLVVAKMLATVPVAEITATEGSTITPTGSLQPITAAGAVTSVLAAPGSGDRVTLINTSANNITIADTTGQALSAAAVLGQWDTLTVVGYGSSWYEVSRSNN